MFNEIGKSETLTRIEKAALFDLESIIEARIEEDVESEARDRFPVSGVFEMKRFPIRLLHPIHTYCTMYSAIH